MALVMLRLLLNGGPPIFSEQDNPASFSKSPVTRWEIYAYYHNPSPLELVASRPDILIYSCKKIVVFKFILSKAFYL